jgi:nitroreductase
MYHQFSVEEAIKNRVSVRNYKEQVIEAEKLNQLSSFINDLSNPFNRKVNFYMFEINEGSSDQKIGTYGVIKGAKHFIGASIVLEDFALEACGYEMELVILFLASMNIGSCWLGGTFNRKAFATSLNVPENEILPVITPIGYAHEQRHLQEVLMRNMIKAHHRLPWESLFFKDDFQTPLLKEDIGEYAFVCEMVRLAPSASNKQPWRIVYHNQAFHFYQYKTPGYSSAFSYDIQRIDMGIAAAHFELAAKEKGLQGYFVFDQDPNIFLPKNTYYAFTWLISRSEW